MSEFEFQTPERPTAAAIFKAIHAERAGLSVPEYVNSLIMRYDTTGAMIQARILRNAYRDLPWLGETPEQARAIRAAFLDGFAVGYHVVRRSMPEELQLRTVIAPALRGLMEGIVEQHRTDEIDNAAVSSELFDSLEYFVDCTKQRSPEYFAEFEPIELEIAKRPDHVEFTRLGFGIAIGVGLVVQDAALDEGVEEG